MYLVRAEANARLGAEAAVVRADVDVVRARAGLGPLAETVDTGEELVDAVLRERRLEMAFEGAPLLRPAPHGAGGGRAGGGRSAPLPDPRAEDGRQRPARPEPGLLTGLYLADRSTVEGRR